jgi:hypothetical protein
LRFISFQQPANNRNLIKSLDVSFTSLIMFIYILLNCEPVRQGILGMLKPVDIVSLVLAAQIVTTPRERIKYLTLFRQLFFDDSWVEKIRGDGGNVFIMGKDLRRFYEGLQTWDYYSLKNKINLLLVVKQPSLTPQAHLEENGCLLDTIDGTCLWTTSFTVGPTNCKKSNGDHTNVEVYTIFTNRNMRIALDNVWTDRLFFNNENLIAVDDTEALGPGLRNARNYTWSSNSQENINGLSLAAIEITPLSRNTYWGVGSILRTQGNIRFLVKRRRTQGSSDQVDILFY